MDKERVIAEVLEIALFHPAYVTRYVRLDSVLVLGGGHSLRRIEQNYPDELTDAGWTELIEWAAKWATDREVLELVRKLPEFRHGGKFKVVVRQQTTSQEDPPCFTPTSW